MSIKNKLYYHLVEKHSPIRNAYQGFVNSNPEQHKRKRVRSWVLLLLLNIQYRICGNISTSLTAKAPANTLAYPESSMNWRIPVDELVEILSKYDVVSFDVFDTLIFRACADPKDLFILIGNRLGIMNFRDIRVNAEKEARQTSEKPFGEVNIYDIYKIIQRKCGIDIQKGISAELLAEEEVCFANPYMKDVVAKLVTKGKKVIATSNMYLNQEIISQLLKSCGYTEFQNDVFVSCDNGCSKHKGRLQKKVWNLIGTEKSVIHVGDNYNVDFIGSRMAGWKSFYYKNVNEIGKPYRPANMSALGGSVYSGLVNAKLHNGLCVYDPYYELGYAYGGILACSYCSWLNEYARKNNIDKFLFSSRDMYLVHKIYNQYYHEVDNDYIMLSRFAAQRFSYKQFSEYFVNSHIKARSNIRKLTIGEAFEELDISFACAYLDEYGLSADMLFTPDEFLTVKQCFEDHKERFLQEFESERQAALQYYLPLIEGKKRVAVVDLGWQGTNALCLKSLIEENTTDTIVYSVLMCATGAIPGYTHSGGISDSFCFSPQHNTQIIGNFRMAKSIGRFPCELLFSAPEDGLKYFKNDNGKIVPVLLKTEQRDMDKINLIASGILDYAKEYHALGKIGKEIHFSGFESMLPLNKLVYNSAYIKQIMNENDVNPWIGTLKNAEGTNINHIVK